MSDARSNMIPDDDGHPPKPMGTPEPEPDINVTPLVDISLVLVIIFLVTSPFMNERDITVVSNKQKKEAQQINKSVKLSLILSLDPKTKETVANLKEEILENNKKRTDAKNYAIGDDLAAAIDAKISTYQKDDRVLYFEPKDDVTHGAVVTCLDLAKSKGVERLSFVQPEAPKPAGFEE